MFLIWKPAVFRKVKEIKYLSGGVVLYAAQSNMWIDAEIAEKGDFQTETSFGDRLRNTKDPGEQAGVFCVAND